MSDRSYAVAEQAHQLRRQIESAEEKLRMLQQIPQRDAYAHGATVLVVVRPRYGRTDEELTYVFLKIVNADERPIARTEKWYFTGTLYGRGRMQHNQAGWIRWDQLVSWLVHDVEIVRWNDLIVKEIQTP